MPEGPECRVIAEGLESYLKGNEITGFNILSGRYFKHGPPNYWEEFLEDLPLTCLSVRVKGKFIYLNFGKTSGPEWFLWNTLGMSGKWSSEKNSHSRVMAAFNSDSGKQDQIYFEDQRNFGTLKLSKDVGELETKLKSLGADFLNEDHAPSTTLAILEMKRNRSRTLPEILMDQRNYAGVGNYIKAEALYRSGLSPHRTGESLSYSEVMRLHRQIKRVIRSSYAARGFSMKNFSSVSGEQGTFKKLIYGQKRDPNGLEVVAEKTKDKRTTYWVPSIQK